MMVRPASSSLSGMISILLYQYVGLDSKCLCSLSSSTFLDGESVEASGSGTWVALRKSRSEAGALKLRVPARQNPLWTPL